MGELKKRIITGLCLGPAIAFLFYFLPPVWLLVLLTAIALVAVYEASALAGISCKYLVSALVVLGMTPLYFRWFQHYVLWIMASTVVIIAVSLFDRKTPLEEANRQLTGQVSVLVFGNIFILIPFFYLYLLKDLDTLFPFILLVSIWSSDTFAYAIGKKLGRHKLAPRISPKKTVEGLLGSVLGSLIIVTAAYRFLGLTLPGAIAIGAAMGLLGQAGDLLESACKRVFGTKDSSGLIPGHGGLLDRIDSFIFTAPFLYTCLVWTR